MRVPWPILAAGLLLHPTEAARADASSGSRSRGEAIGAFSLGRMSHYGLGVPVDLVRAEPLYRQAIAGGWDSTKSIKLDEAETFAREVVDATPDPTPTRATHVDTLAWVLFKQGRLAEAATKAKLAR